MPRPRPFINRLVQDLASLTAAALPRPKALDWKWHRDEVLESCRAELARSTRKEILIRRLPYEIATLYGDTPRRFEQVFREVENALNEAYERSRRPSLEDVWAGRTRNDR